MTAKSGRQGRAAFTMIEVLTVAAIAVIIMGLTIPAYGWLTESREREKVSETIAAQVMGARAIAVQYRTYAGVMVRCIGASNQCASTRSGTIRMIQVNPRDVNDPVWNKSFYWVPGRTAAGIPSGVGFARGYRPTAGTLKNDLSLASVFFIVFGPDGVLRVNWPVQYVYARNNSLNLDGNVCLDTDRAASITGAIRTRCLPVNNFNTTVTVGAVSINQSPSNPSVNCFAIYDWKKLLEEKNTGLGTSSQNTQVTMNFGATTIADPASLLTRLYSANTAGALVRDDLLCRRTFINPYTGLGIRETVTPVNPGGAGNTYVDLDP